ncbi:MAG: hypothetical protein ABIA63_02230, partial [bacterium]
LDGSAREIASKRPDNDFFIIFNADNKSIIQKVPNPPANKNWHMVMDTYRPGTFSFAAPGRERLITQMSIKIMPKSTVVLIARIAENS